MLARLIEFSLAQRMLVAVLTLGLVVAGWQSFRTLPIDAFPEISPTQVKLIMKAPGMTPEEVESRVVAPLEMELPGIPRQRVLRSAAKYAIADITIDFEDGIVIGLRGANARSLIAAVCAPRRARAQPANGRARRGVLRSQRTGRSRRRHGHAGAELLRAHAGEPWLMRQILRVCPPLLDAVLARPRLAIGAAVVSLLLGAAAYLGTGKTFLPTLDEGDILVQLEKLPSIQLDASQAIDLAVQRELLARVPEIEHAVARVGSDELGFDPMSLNQTDMFLKLKPPEQWQVADKDALIEHIRSVLDGFPGVAYGFTQPIEMRVSEMLTGTRGDVAVKIFGPDLAVLDALAQQVASTLEQVAGSQDVFLVANEGVQYLSARVEGVPAGNLLDGNRRVPLLVRGDEDLRHDAAAFTAATLTRDDGGAVPLSRVLAFERTAGPVEVDRENASRFAVVQSNVGGRDKVGFVADAQQAVAQQVALPDGYRLVWGGQFENQQRAAARLALVVPIALGAIFLTLFSTFGAVRPALLILANIPFALVGGVIALWLSGEYLSVPAAVGFIALLGIAVLNGLVMVAFFTQLRAAGASLAHAVREGAIRRLRPVLMTASITALGLVPLLFASGPGSEIQRPLAVVVIGGLLSATPLTLLLPLLYRRFGERADV